MCLSNTTCSKFSLAQDCLSPPEGCGDVYEFERLASKFPQLTHIEANLHGGLPSRELFMGLCSLKNLKSLKIENWVSRIGLDDLVMLPGLHDLEIQDTGANAARLQAISRLTQLTAICLYDDFEGCDALDCLSCLVRLKELDVVWDSCRGNPLLVFPTGLTKLQLWMNYLPNAECFGAGLTRLAHLQDLFLGCEDLCSLGSCLTMLSRLAFLSALALAGSCDDWNSCTLAILKDCAALCSLSIEFLITDDALLDLSLTPQLKALQLDWMRCYDLSCLSRLSMLTSICMGRTFERVQVCLTHLTSMDFLRAVPDLQTLSMCRCEQVSSSAFNSISSLSQLVRLELPRCAGVKPGFLMQLKAMTCLTHLNLSKNPWVQTEYASALIKLSALVELDLMGCCELANEALQYLQGKPNLRKLSLARNHWLSRVGMRSGLTGLVALEVLDLNCCQNVTEVDLLFACERLRLLHLRVWGMDLSDAGRARLKGPVGVCKVWPWWCTSDEPLRDGNG